jgi:fumarylacetoacetase
VSGTVAGSAGCLLEMTRGGRNAVSLPNGETRAYLEDGDEISFLGRAHRAGYASIGFGACRGTVTEALSMS